MGSTGSEAGWVGSSRPFVYSYSATLFPPHTLLLFSFSGSFSTFYCCNLKNWPGTLLLLILYLFVGSGFKSRSRRRKETVWEVHGKLGCTFVSSSLEKVMGA